MLARLLSLLVLLAVAAGSQFETVLEEGQTPSYGQFRHQGTYRIPDGQCNGGLNLVSECKGPGQYGIRTLKVKVTDVARYPTMTFIRNALNKIVQLEVFRGGNCKGQAVVAVDVKCDYWYHSDKSNRRGLNVINSQRNDIQGNTIIDADNIISGNEVDAEIGSKNTVINKNNNLPVVKDCCPPM